MATRPVILRTAEAAVPPDVAWRALADLDGWPAWARHVRRITVVPDGPLGPTSAGRLHLRGGLRATFEMSAWEPPDRWEWVGRAAGCVVRYDHRFEATPTGTRLVWAVELSGPTAGLLARPFAVVYGRLVDRALPRFVERLVAASQVP